MLFSLSKKTSQKNYSTDVDKITFFKSSEQIEVVLGCLFNIIKQCTFPSNLKTGEKSPYLFLTL